eukprot:768444-Hanusia_phi.AAC.5
MIQSADASERVVGQIEGRQAEEILQPRDLTDEIVRGVQDDQRGRDALESCDRVVGKIESGEGNISACQPR